METSDHHLSTPLEDGILTSDDKQWGMLAHIGTFLGAVVPFGNIIVPLVLMSLDSSNKCNSIMAV